MIPKIIHQIWLTDVCAMPEVYQAWQKSWQKLNPDFEYNLWDDSAWNLFGGKAFWYEKYKLFGVHPGITSDLLRALIVQKFGGFYADMDTECHKSISKLTLTEGIFCYDNYSLLMAGFFGCVANEPILEYVLTNATVDGDLLSRVGCRLFNSAVITGITESHTVLGINKAKEYFTHHYKRSWL